MKPKRVEIITEAEILAGMHDFVHHIEKHKPMRTTCSRCGREPKEVMNSKSPGCDVGMRVLPPRKARSRKPKRKKKVPRAALARVLAMAEEMSGENSYQEWDAETGEGPFGVDPKVQRDLDAVRKWLGTKKGTKR